MVVLPGEAPVRSRGLEIIRVFFEGFMLKHGWTYAFEVQE